MKKNQTVQEEQNTEIKIDELREQKKKEINLSVDKLQKCREIVFEIKKFGVSQKEILHIISLLALELDNIVVGADIRQIAKDTISSMPKEDWEFLSERLSRQV